jgi:hypothetical protein
MGDHAKPDTPQLDMTALGESLSREERRRLTKELGEAPEPVLLRSGEIPLPRKWTRLGLDGRLEIGPAYFGDGLRLHAPPSVVEVFDLPEEVTPRIIDLDHRDVVALREFVQAFGGLGVSRSDLEKDREGAELPDITGSASDHVSWAGSMGWEVDDLQAAVAAIKALALLKREIREADRFSPYRLAAEWPWASPWSCPTTRSAAEFLFLSELRRGLLYTSLTLYGSLTAREDPLSLGLAFRDSLYGRCVLEIVNATLAHRPYRRCANERCKRTFSMQGGARSSDVHRTDIVRFCSRECARAQASRDYRRRKRQSRE